MLVLQSSVTSVSCSDGSGSCVPAASERLSCCTHPAHPALAQDNGIGPGCSPWLLVYGVLEQGNGASESLVDVAALSVRVFWSDDVLADIPAPKVSCFQAQLIFPVN